MTANQGIEFSGTRWFYVPRSMLDVGSLAEFETDVTAGEKRRVKLVEMDEMKRF